MSQGSYNGRLYSDFVRMSRRRGGSHDTLGARERTLKKFSIWLLLMNIQLRTAASVHNRHFRAYIDARKEDGLRSRSMENIASHLRVMPQLTLTNRELGINGGSRVGKRQACPKELFLKACYQIEHPGIRAALLLMWALGLRAQEAIASGPSLKSWLRAVLNGRKPYVVFGTKGGRDREVEIPDRALALYAIREALAALKVQRRKRLVPSRTRRTALRIFHRECRKVGLTGGYSPHSLRYAFAHRLVRYFASLGLSEREAFAATAISLGHGDGRARFVKQVYGRGLPAYAELLEQYRAQDIRRSELLARYSWRGPTSVCLLPAMWNVGVRDERFMSAPSDNIREGF